MEIRDRILADLARVDKESFGVAMIPDDKGRPLLIAVLPDDIINPDQILQIQFAVDQLLVSLLSALTGRSFTMARAYMADAPLDQAPDRKN